MPNKLQQFLEFLPKQREASLAIARDGQEIKQFAKELKTNNFSLIKRVFDYDKIKGDKYLIMNDEKHFKEIYDFICQYPLTIITIYNQEKNENTAIKPDYEKAILLIITKENLTKFNQAGFDILGRAGLTFQS